MERFALGIICLFLLCCTACSHKPDAEKSGNAPQAGGMAQLLAGAGQLQGDTAPFDKPAKGYVLVYAPSLNDDHAFDAGLHTAGMFTYFESEAGPKVETIMAAKDDKAVFDGFMAKTKENAGIYNALTFVHDPGGQLLEKLEIDPESLQYGGVAITYDAGGNELFRETDYKCQGEKLQRMHQHFYPKKLTLSAPDYEITAGQKIPDQLLPHLSGHLGKSNLLVTFYPAPLSHSCSIQMSTLGNMAAEAAESKELKALAVSLGSLPQVEAWQLHQPTKGLQMVADTSGGISNAFNSLLTDEHGVTYSDRTVFLIDKAGVVKYVNRDYDVRADLDILESEIAKL